MATFNAAAVRVKAIVDAVTSAPTSVIKKDDVISPRELDAITTALVVIWFGGDETDVWSTTGSGASDTGSTGKRFAIGLSYYKNNLGNVASDLSTIPDFWQEAIRALDKAGLAGLLSAWNVTIETHEAWEKQGFGDGHEVSRLVIHVEVSEARN